LTFLLQLVLAYPSAFLLAIPLLEAFPSQVIVIEEINYEIKYKVHFVDSLILLASGLALGIASAASRPSLVQTGKWIWGPPGSLFLLLLIGDLRRSSMPGPEPMELFYSSGGNEALAVVFVTMPFFSSLGYSLGMMAAASCSERIRMALRTVADTDRQDSEASGRL
jgi:hypothetical protein